MASANIQNSIKAGLLSSTGLNPVQSNTPARAEEIYSKYKTEAIHYYEYMAPYASNVFDAEIQGLDYNDFYAWTKVKIRASNAIDPSTGENLSTSWQKILVLDRSVDFLSVGAYVKFAGSVWIVFNPDNIASPTGDSIVVRCNTTYNTRDYYGNIVKTPMYYAKGSILASSPYYMEYSATLDGYQHIIMQLNDVTKNITNNTRIILGNSAFGMYGVANFHQEFTGDDTSCHILRADLRLQETLDTDDIENHIADGKYFSITLNVGGSNVMHVNDSQKLEASVQKNGVFMESTEEHPLTYEWSSSDSNIAEVDDFGNVTAISEGYCSISCKLSQNENVFSEFGFNVVERTELDYVDFVTPTPQEVRAYEEFSIEAAYFEDGVQTAEPIQYTFGGVAESAFTFEQSANIITIRTWASSVQPLVITAHYNSYSQAIKIQILGY